MQIQKRDEFLERLEDEMDLKAIEDREDEPSMSWEQAKGVLGLNETTVTAINNIEKGIGLHETSSVEEMIKELESPETLEDEADIKAAREALKDSYSVPLEQVEKELDL